MSEPVIKGDASTGFSFSWLHEHPKMTVSGSVDFDGNILSGTIPNKQKKLIVAWIELRKEELITLWNMLQSGNGTFTIEPLK